MDFILTPHPQVDWALVADNMDITNGHAARMRYARYKNQVEGVQPRPREPRNPNSSGSSKNSRGRPVKKQKLEQGKKEEDERGVKKDPDAPAGDKGGKRKIKSEGGEEGMPQAKMTGGLGPGAGIKREFDDVDAEGEVDETAENHMDLTWNASTSEKSPRRKGSKTEMAVRIKTEPVDGVEGGSPKRIRFSKSTVGGEEGADAPAGLIEPNDLSTTTPAQPASAISAAKASTSPHTSTRPVSPQLHILQPQEHQPISPTATANQTTIRNMQHFQLSQPPPSQRLFSNDMSMAQTHTPPNHSSNGGQAHAFQYPVPSYHSYAEQSPATTSSAPYSLPPSPVGGVAGGYSTDINGYNMAQGSYDMNGIHNGMNGGMMMNQGSFVGMLEDPSFPSGGQMYGSSGSYGVGGWEDMYQ